jgi:hypothetical protein
MQIYLHLNGKQTGPLTLPRVSSKLVSGEVPPDTLAWREGLDNWYPLSHETWAEVGIVVSVAPTPAPVPTPVPQPVTVETETVAPTAEDHPAASVGGNEPLEDSAEGQAEDSVEAVPEEVGKAFSEYAEEDFKPPSFDEMDQEMSSLRTDRESLPGLIGERSFDAGIEDEEIEDAKAEVAKARQSGDQTAIHRAHKELGQVVLAAGIHDDSIVELREREQELSDRMLNLQMQARRMGGGTRVKKNKPWMKWVFIFLAVALIGGTIAIANLLK